MRGLWRRITELARRQQLDREAVEEMRDHVEMLVARKIAAGVVEDEARRQTRLELGSIDAAREEVALGRSGVVAEQIVRETAYAARVLGRSRGTTLLSILTMAAGIGVSGVLFALVDGIVLRPLPYPDPDRLVRIFDTNPQAGIERTGTATGNIGQWRQRATQFEGIAGYYAMGRTVSVEGDAEAVITTQVSRDFFSVLGVAPAIGRVFTSDECERARFNSAAAPIGADPVAILSHGLWLRRFGADRGVIGRTISVDRRPFKIIGVMPQGFAMPDAGAQLWIPWHISPDHPKDQHYVSAIARVKAATPIDAAEAHLNGVARDLEQAYPETNRGWRVTLSPLAIETVGGTAAVLWLLLAAVGLVLLVACANIAVLSIIRGIDRRHETSVRVALGASAGRLIREFLLESAVLAAAGGLLGAAVAAAGLRWLPALAPDLPRIEEVSFGSGVFAFIAAATTLTALLSGVPHAWKRSRGNAVTALGTARITDSPGTHRLRDAMVVGQVAMAVVLMMGSGLLLRSFQQLRSTNAGFDPSGVLVAPIFLDSQRYDSGDKTRSYYRTVSERLLGIPGVVSVGGATTVPTSPLGPDFERPVWPATATAPSERLPAAVRMITPGYIRTMGLSLVEGRAIDDRDSPLAPRVLMVSQTLSKRLWPGQSAVGRQLVVDYSTAGTYPYEVVGVIGDVRFRGPRSEPLPEIYLPHAQRSYLIMNVVVKTTGDPRAVIPAVREVLRTIDPQKPAQGLYPLTDLLGATYARDRQAMTALASFAAAAMFLAALSVYGVLSQRVRERAREIGIRIAMGAGTPKLLKWTAASGLRLIGLGLAVGAAAAYAMSSIVEGLLYGVAATDAVSAMGSVAGLAIIGVIAVVIPAWRATRIDPVQILRRG